MKNSNNSNIEQEALNETQDSFFNSINEEEYNFDLELEEYERLDVEAQSVAPTFFVR